jgi:uncharacterized protein (UPF0332 family)
MPTTPAETLDSAIKIGLLGNPTEADVRSAVSRAYYAALHGVADVFTGSGLSHEKSSHEIIIERAESYGRSLNPGRTEAQQAARKLKMFKRIRKEADYHLELDFPPVETARAIEMSKAIIEFCSIIKAKQTTTT